MGGSQSTAETTERGCADARKVGVFPGRDGRCAEDGCFPGRDGSCAEDGYSPGETYYDYDLMLDCSVCVIGLILLYKTGINTTTQEVLSMALGAE